MGLIEKVAAGPAGDEPGRDRSSSRRSSKKGDFTLDDFRKQFEQMKKMGPMKDMMAAMPGMGDMIPEGEDPEEAVKRIQGMIDSMTKEERRNPDIIDMSRRRRIAAGSGTEPHDIKQFLGQFEQVRTLMRQMAKMSIWERIKMVTGMGKAGAFSPAPDAEERRATPAIARAPKERAEERKKKRRRSEIRVPQSASREAGARIHVALRAGY